MALPSPLRKGAIAWKQKPFGWNADWMKAVTHAFSPATT